MHIRSAVSIGAAFVLAGCTAAAVDGAQAILGFDAAVATDPPTPPRLVDHARAVLRNDAGEDIGTARFSEDAEGIVRVTVHAKQLTPGLHGLHLHTVGACDATTTPAFASAGGHYNPTGKQHGHHNPEGFHSGDLPNLSANAAGVARLSISLEQFRLADLFDADGAALVVHAGEDDRTTNNGPAGPGNSGARFACGTLQR